MGRARIALFLVGGVLLTVALNTGYQFVNTLARLDVVERERDQWQRPIETIQALDLRDGSVVVDLGSGSGYFALRLSSVVGEHGKVLAVDTRRLPLLFLWVRAILRKQHNVIVSRAEPNDPHLAPGAADAVLVANTYHELTDPKKILQWINRGLVQGGRLVILDRGPRSNEGEPAAIEARHHELPLTLVESDVRRQGFEIVSRRDDFIDVPGRELWWLIVARKP